MNPSSSGTDQVVKRPSHTPLTRAKTWRLDSSSSLSAPITWIFLTFHNCRLSRPCVPLAEPMHRLRAHWRGTLSWLRLCCGRDEWWMCVLTGTCTDFFLLYGTYSIVWSIFIPQVRGFLTRRAYRFSDFPYTRSLLPPSKPYLLPPRISSWESYWHKQALSREQKKVVSGIQESGVFWDATSFCPSQPFCHGWYTPMLCNLTSMHPIDIFELRFVEPATPPSYVCWYYFNSLSSS
jgi:hypothetical protein